MSKVFGVGTVYKHVNVKTLEEDEEAIALFDNQFRNIDCYTVWETNILKNRNINLEEKTYELHLDDGFLHIDMQKKFYHAGYVEVVRTNDTDYDVRIKLDGTVELPYGEIYLGASTDEETNKIDKLYFILPIDRNLSMGDLPTTC